MKQIADQAGSKYYQCGECGFGYEGKEWAEECETWCSMHRSCNIEITNRAIKTGEDVLA